MKAEIILALMVMVIIGAATGIAATLWGVGAGFAAFSITAGAVLTGGFEA